jgi:hypothetical protein
VRCMYVYPVGQRSDFVWRQRRELIRSDSATSCRVATCSSHESTGNPQRDHRSRSTSPHDSRVRNETLACEPRQHFAPPRTQLRQTTTPTTTLRLAQAAGLQPTPSLRYCCLRTVQISRVRDAFSYSVHAQHRRQSKVVIKLIETVAEDS